MIELELFYKIVEAKIRKDHGNYLQNLKRDPVELSAEKRGLFARLFCKRKKIRIPDKLLKGYNAGIKKALDVLKAEFVKFNKRLKREEERGSKF